MADFYRSTQETVRDLNKTERKLFDYVVKNMDKVKQMSIRELAAEQFLSTATIFRFAKRLGFSGYADFINSLIVTSHSRQSATLPDSLTGRGYREDYLKNTLESVRVMSEKQVGEVVEKLVRKPNIYI